MTVPIALALGSFVIGAWTYGYSRLVSRTNREVLALRAKEEVLRAIVQQQLLLLALLPLFTKRCRAKLESMTEAPHFSGVLSDVHGIPAMYERLEALWKYPSSNEESPWGCVVNALEATGTPVYSPSSQIMKDMGAFEEMFALASDGEPFEMLAAEASLAPLMANTNFLQSVWDALPAEIRAHLVLVADDFQDYDKFYRPCALIEAGSVRGALLGRFEQGPSIEEHSDIEEREKER